MKFSLAYTGSTTFKFFVNTISKTSGTYLDESSWTNPLPQVMQGEINLNADKTKWATLINVDNPSKLSF